jgi:hypothetical protein
MVMDGLIASFSARAAKAAVPIRDATSPEARRRAY